VPTWLIVVLVVFALLVIALFVLGLIGARRRDRDRDAAFGAELEKANAALAEARASDRGWERSILEAAARAAHERAHPGAEIRELHLVQVVDRPGTDEDQARFRVMDAHGEHDILLGRRGDQWNEVA
jgi:hypothetical protein